MKKILIINDNNLSFLGGERESQLIIINGIKDKYKVSVIQPGLFEEKIDGVDFYSLTKCKRMKQLIKNVFAFFIYILKVGVKINKINPDIIHSQSQVSFFIVSLLRRFGIISKKTIFIHTDRGLYTKYSKFYRWLFQFSFKYLDCLVTTTYFNNHTWKEANDAKGIDLSYYVVGNTAGEIYEKIDYDRIQDNENIVVGFAGRMCDWKGWPLAEKIVCAIDSKCKNSFFKMYISCLDDTSMSETKMLFERMKDLLGDRFEGRINVPFTEMEEFYYSLDVFVLTSDSKSESFGRTVVEAMSRYTAILSTDAGGTEEVIGNNERICFEVDDFVRQIAGWYSDKTALLQEKERNLERVRLKYSLESNVTGYINVYEEMCNGL